MKLRLRAVRTDNGPGWSHVGHEVISEHYKHLNLGVNGNPSCGVFFLTYWSRPRANRAQRYFYREVSIEEYPSEKLTRPKGSAFPYQGIHNPGSGYLEGDDFFDTPTIKMIGKWVEITSGEARHVHFPIGRHTNAGLDAMFK